MKRASQALDGVSDPLLSGLRRIAPGDFAVARAGAASSCSPRCGRSDRSRGLRRGSPNGRARQSLGRFELLEQVGVGSFGYVFRARDTELGRMVAIKIPRAGSLASQEDAARFLREARSAAQLKHPGIVTIHETGQAEDGTFYLVEEFVQGTTPRASAEQPARFRFAEAAELIAAVVRRARLCPPPRRDPPRHQALQYPARCRGPPAPDGLRPGQARGRRNRHDPGRPGAGHAGLHVARAGARRIAPGRRPHRHLQPGVVLYELLTGERPFRGNRRMLIMQVLDDEPRPPRQLNDKIPRDLETICLKAMAKSPARRYPSASELAEDLRRFLSGEPIRARPIGWPERLRRWFLRNPVAASLLLAVSLGSAVGLWHLSPLSAQLVQSTALEGAAQQAEMLDVVNAFYTSEVVDRVQPHGIVVTHDYATRKRGDSAAGVFMIESGQRIGERSKTGMQFRLYSDYPFRSRKDGGPHDEFERDALDGLRQQPRRSGLSVRGFQGPAVAAICDGAADGGELHRLPQQRPEQHQAGLEGGRSRRRARDHPPARPRHRPHPRGAAGNVHS